MIMTREELQNEFGDAVKILNDNKIYFILFNSKKIFI